MHHLKNQTEIYLYSKKEMEQYSLNLQISASKDELLKSDEKLAIAVISREL